MKQLFLLILSCLLANFAKGEELPKIYFINSAGCIIDSTELNTYAELSQEFVSQKKPSPFLYLINKKRKSNKKVVAALLAFPFPFGIVGLHRIYLGTAPYVPVVYIASLGGVFGILPFIDFCILALDKDIERYNNNPKVFMWVND